MEVPHQEIRQNLHPKAHKSNPYRGLFAYVGYGCLAIPTGA